MTTVTKFIGNWHGIRLLLTDEPLLSTAVGVIPGVVQPPQLDAVLCGSPRSTQGRTDPPVLVVPGSAVLPAPGPVHCSVCPPQPAVVGVTVSREDREDHQVLSLR